MKFEPRLVLILEVDAVVQLKTNNALSCKKAVHPGKFAESTPARAKDHHLKGPIVQPTDFSKTSYVHSTGGPAVASTRQAYPPDTRIRAHHRRILADYHHSAGNLHHELSTQPVRSRWITLDGRFRVLLWNRSRHCRSHFAYHRSKDETRAGVEGIADLLLTDSVTRVYSTDPPDQCYVEVGSAKASL